MLFTALCLTFIVFFMTNLYPNLEKLAKSEGNFRMDDAAVQTMLSNRGYLQPLPVKYGQWLGVLPGYVIEGTDDKKRRRCQLPAMELEDVPKFCGILQGYWGYSTVFKDEVSSIIGTRLSLTAKLMFWVMLVMIPSALIVGVVAGMREGSRTDRTLSTFAITTTATPEYVSGVIFIAIFSGNFKRLI